MQSGGEENKTDRLNSEDKSRSAHPPTSIWAPAAANLKWIQHFLSHYPFSLNWPDPIGSNQPANQPSISPPPPAFNWSYFLIMAIWTRYLFDYTVSNHFRCFSHSTNCHICTCCCVFHPLQRRRVAIGDAGRGRLQPLTDRRLFINIYVTFRNVRKHGNILLMHDWAHSLTRSRMERLRFRRDKMPKADIKKAQWSVSLNKRLFMNTISDPKASVGTWQY